MPKYACGQASVVVSQNEHEFLILLWCFFVSIRNENELGDMILSCLKCMWAIFGYIHYSLSDLFLVRSNRAEIEKVGEEVSSSDGGSVGKYNQILSCLMMFGFWACLIYLACLVFGYKYGIIFLALCFFYAIVGGLLLRLVNSPDADKCSFKNFGYVFWFSVCLFVFLPSVGFFLLLHEYLHYYRFACITSAFFVLLLMAILISRFVCQNIDSKKVNRERYWAYGGVKSMDCKGLYISNSIFNGVTLDGSTFAGSSLRESSFVNASLRNVDFSNVRNLQVRTLSGSDLSGAILPAGFFDEVLDNIKSLSSKTEKIFYLNLSVCFFWWIARLSITDMDILTQSRKILLPIFNVEVSAEGFFLLTPGVIFFLHIYFLLNLKTLFLKLKRLPAIFPCGTSVHHKVSPFMINFLIRYKFTHADSHHNYFLIHGMVVMFLAWLSVPFTLFAFWHQFFPMMKFDVMFFQISFLCLSFFFDFSVLYNFYIDDNASILNLNGLRLKRGPKSNFILLGLLAQLLTGAIFISFASYFTIQSSELVSTPLSVYKRFDEVNLEPKSTMTGRDRYDDNWFLTHLYGNIEGRSVLNDSEYSFERRFLFVPDYLPYLNARNAFLPGIDLSHKLLIHATFERASLVGANFNLSDLRGVSFRNTDLSQASFNYVKYDNWWKGVDWREANITGAEFSSNEIRTWILDNGGFSNSPAGR